MASNAENVSIWWRHHANPAWYRREKNQTITTFQQIKHHDDVESFGWVDYVYVKLWRIIKCTYVQNVRSEKIWYTVLRFENRSILQWEFGNNVVHQKTWKNAWATNREADDLGRHRAHYDVIVMAIQDASDSKWDQEKKLKFHRYILKYKLSKSNFLWRFRTDLKEGILHGRFAWRTLRGCLQFNAFVCIAYVGLQPLLMARVNQERPYPKGKYTSICFSKLLHGYVQTPDCDIWLWQRLCL